jgi:hypothetical protein
MGNEKKEEIKLDETLDKSLAELEKAIDEDAKSDKPAEEIDKAKKKEDEDEDEDAKGKKEEKEDAKKEGDEDEDAKGKEDEDEDAKGKKDEDEDKKEDEDDKGKKEDEEAKGKKKEKKDEEDPDEDEGKEKEKSFAEKVSEKKEMKDALEVSDFLKNLVKSLSDELAGLTSQVADLRKSNRKFREAIVKSAGTQNEMIKSLGESIDSFGDTALPAKSKQVATVEKSFRNNESSTELSKAQITDKIAELECDGKLEPGSTTRFEVSGLMTPNVKKLVLGE